MFARVVARRIRLDPFPIASGLDQTFPIRFRTNLNDRFVFFRFLVAQHLHDGGIGAEHLRDADGVSANPFPVFVEATSAHVLVGAFLQKQCDYFRKVLIHGPHEWCESTARILIIFKRFTLYRCDHRSIEHSPLGQVSKLVFSLTGLDSTKQEATNAKPVKLGPGVN